MDRLITSTCSLEQINEACKEMLDGGEGRKKQISIENTGSQFFS